MDAERPESLAELRARLEALGFRPTQSLGQNFLVDPKMLDAIARDARLEGDELVVEVGPGPAWLTRRLAARARRVVALELDARLAAVAREATAELGNVEIVEGDALGGSKSGLHPAIARALEEPRCVVVANLPYAIAPALLANLFDRDVPPRRAVVLVQREVADRLTAHESTKEFGALTVIVRANAAVERLREVPPEVFRPRPSVRSTLVALSPREDRPDAETRRKLRVFVDAAFGERRKQLASRLAALGLDGAAVLARHGLRPDVRGEALSVETFLAIAKREPFP